LYKPDSHSDILNNPTKIKIKPIPVNRVVKNVIGR
jgi:hypothetical protein